MDPQHKAELGAFYAARERRLGEVRARIDEIIAKHAPTSVEWRVELRKLQALAATLSHGYQSRNPRPASSETIVTHYRLTVMTPATLKGLEVERK